MKTKRRFLIFTSLLFLAPFFAIPASAAADITLFGGVQNPGNITLRSATGSLLNTGPKTFGTFGARLAVGNIVGSEHTFAYSPNFLTTQHSAFIYNSNFLVQAPLPVVRPYGTVGIGTIWVRGTGLQAVTGAKFALNYGGGVKIRIFGPLGVQADARGYYIRGINSQSMNMLETSLGVLFSF
jgi:hypothetical protein